MSAWHESDEFWEASGIWIFRPAAWEKAEAQVERLVGLIGVEPPARVLDMCCGPGRHSIPLARLGYRVTGVDRTQRFLDEAARRAKSEGLEFELVRADMREFSRPDSFDVAINLLTSFGYFEDEGDDRRAFSGIHESLASGGIFVVDTMGKEVLARIYQEHDWKEVNGETWLFERHVDSAWRWMENRWIRYRDAERKEFKLRHRLFSASELIELVKSCGFASAEAYGSYDGAPYDQKAERLIVVAHK